MTLFCSHTSTLVSKRDVFISKISAFVLPGNAITGYATVSPARNLSSCVSTQLGSWLKRSLLALRWRDKYSHICCLLHAPASCPATQQRRFFTAGSKKTNNPQIEYLVVELVTGSYAGSVSSPASAPPLDPLVPALNFINASCELLE